MANEKEISKIKKNGTIYGIKDKTAREDIARVEETVEAINNNFLPRTALDNLNLEGYATKDELGNYATVQSINSINSSISSISGRTSTLESNITNLNSQVSALQGLNTGVTFVTSSTLENTLSNYATLEDLTTAVGNIDGYATDQELNTAVGGALTEAKNYTDQKFANIQVEPVEINQTYSHLISASLEDVMTPGYYKITDAVDTPNSTTEDGYLNVTAFKDGTIKQEWHTREYDAMRICEDGDSNITVTVLDKTYGQTDADYYVDNNGVLKLLAQHSYRLSGYYKGQIKIVGNLVNDDAVVIPTVKTYIELDGLIVTNSGEYSIGYFLENKSLELHLVKDKYNFLVSKQPVDAVERITYGAVYSANNLTISGLGYLSVKTNTGAHGFRTSELEFVDMPHIYVNAIHDAFHCGKYAAFHEGYYYVEKAHDGIGCGSDAYFDIYGGTFVFDTITDTIFDSDSNTIASEIQGINTKIIVNSTPANGAVNSIDKVKVLETVYTTGVNIVKVTKSVWFGEPRVYESQKLAQPDADGRDQYSAVEGLRIQPNANGEYILTPTYNGIKRLYLIRGYFNNAVIKIEDPEGLLTSDLVSSNGGGTDIVLERAFLENSTSDTTINYVYEKKSLTVTANDVSYVLNTKPHTTVDTEKHAAIWSGSNLTIKGDSAIYVSATTSQTELTADIDTYGAWASDLIIRGDGLRYFYNSGIGAQGTNVYIGADPDDIAAAGVTPGNSTQTIYALGNIYDINARLSGKGKKSHLVFYQYQKGNIITDKINSLNSEGLEAINANMPGIVYYKTRTRLNLFTSTTYNPAVPTEDVLIASPRFVQYECPVNYRSDFPDTKSGIWYINYSKFTDTTTLLAGVNAELAEAKRNLALLTPKEITFTNYGDDKNPVYDQDQTLGNGLIGKILCYRFACPEVIDDKAVNVKSMAKDGKKIYARDGDYGYPATDGTGQLNFSYEWNIASFPNGVIPNDLVVVPEITPVNLTPEDADYPGYSSFKSQYATAIPGMYRVTKVTDDLQLTCHVMRESEMPAHTITYRLVLPDGYEGQIPTITTYRCGDAMEKIYVDGLTREKIIQKELTQDYDLIEGKVLQFVDGVATDYSYHKDSGLKDLGNITDGTSQFHFVIGNVPEGYSCLPALGPNVVLGKKNGCHLSGFEYNADYNAWEGKKIADDIEVIITLAAPASVTYVAGAYPYSAAPKTYDSQGNPLDKNGNIIPVYGDNAIETPLGSDYTFNIYYDSLRRNWSSVLEKIHGKGNLVLDTPYELTTVGGTTREFTASSTDPNNATGAKVFITAAEALETIDSITVNGVAINKSLCSVSCSGKKAAITIPGNLITGNIVITSVSSARANEPASIYTE